MKKLVMSLVALFALSTAVPAFAGEKAGSKKEKKSGKKGKKGDKAEKKDAAEE